MGLEWAGWLVVHSTIEVDSALSAFQVDGSTSAFWVDNFFLLFYSRFKGQVSSNS
jgi:hypothetical protein